MNHRAKSGWGRAERAGEIALHLTGQGSVPPTDERWLGVKEVAARLGISPRTAAKWAGLGKLRAYRIGRRLRFRWVEVETHLAATCRVQVANAETLKTES